MKKTLGAILFLFTVSVWATPSYYIVSKFEGKEQELFLNALLYCGEAGDFGAAEDYCYAVELNQTKFSIDNNNLIARFKNDNIIAGYLTGKSLPLTRGPGGFGTISQVVVPSLKSKEKYKLVRNVDANGAQGFPPFIRTFESVNFKLTLGSGVSDIGSTPGGFYRKY